MSHLMKVSEAASLALHSMAYLAGSPGRNVSARQVAERLGVSEAHLSKVLQRLAQAGLVKSSRGPKGGFTLKIPAAKITLLDIFETIEGRLEATECLLGIPICNGPDCILGGLLKSVDEQAREYLGQTRLDKFKELFGSGGKADGE
jgi:Rrf2 family protein